MQPKTRWTLGFGGAALLALAILGVAAAHGGFADRSGASTFAQQGDTVSGRSVNFSVDLATATLRNLDPVAANASHPLVVSAQLVLPEGASATGDATPRGYVLSNGAGDQLVVRDGRGLGLATSSVNGTTVTLVFPEGATIVTHEAVASWSPAGATITYANGEVANLVLSPNATLSASGQSVQVTLPASGAMDLHLAGAEGCAQGLGAFPGAHGPHDGRGARGDHGPGRGLR